MPWIHTLSSKSYGRETTRKPLNSSTYCPKFWSRTKMTQACRSKEISIICRRITSRRPKMTQMPPLQTPSEKFWASISMREKLRWVWAARSKKVVLANLLWLSKPAQSCSYTTMNSIWPRTRSIRLWQSTTCLKCLSSAIWETIIRCVWTESSTLSRISLTAFRSWKC